MKGLLFRVPESFGAHPGVADPVKPLFFELIEPPAGHLLEAFEKLIGICVLKTITREVEGLAGFELFLSEQQAEHADNFGRLYIGDPVYQFVRVIEALAHDAAGMSGVLDGQWAEKRISNAFNLVQPDHCRIENVRHELPLHVHSEGLIEPDVEGGLHGRFTAALVMFELVYYHRMGVKEELVQRVLADQGRISDDCGVSGVFHASEIGSAHADGPIGISRVFIVLGRLDPQDRPFEDFHRDLRAPAFARRNKVFKIYGAAVIIDCTVPENVPCPCAGDEKVRGHRNGVVESDDLPVRLTRLANGNAVRVGCRVYISVAYEMRIGDVGFQGRSHCALGAAVVEDGHYSLKAPLLALGHILLRRSGGSDVLVDAFQDVIRRVAHAPGAHGKSFSPLHFARQQDDQLVLPGKILIAKRVPG